MSSKRVLVVEDEQKVASFLKSGLEDNGYQVDVAFDGYIGQRLFLANQYDLILLDVNLPQINGVELCKFVRTKDLEVTVIMLTAMGTTEDKEVGLDSGADDYLVKPFEFRELMARIRRFERRSKFIPSSDKIHRIADLVVNEDSKIVKRGESTISLTNKEFQLLVFMIKNKNKVISRNDISEEIWGINFERGTNVIDVYVNFLRKKIDKDFTPKLIHTQIGMGYILKVGGKD
ncbi:MAG: response regulator transcription factor [Bacteroidota bacterium]|nr:response regulator transcription factor [Bacteroidota bacterium]